MKRISKFVTRSVSNEGEFIKALDPKNLGLEQLDEPTDHATKVTMVMIEKWKTMH